MRSLVRAVATPFLLGLTACASAPGEPIDFEAMVADLAAQDVVFLGEEHDNDVGHLQHLQLLKMLHASRPELVLSMEMFERDVQEVVDAYLAGTIDEAKFLADSRPWGRYRTHYRPMVEYAKRHGLPVIAANAPTALARRVASEGVAAVLGGPHVAAATSAPKDRYWQDFLAAMEGHVGVDENTVYRYYESQCLKDDTMAESILAARAAADPAPLVVHVNGKFHSDGGLGTAARVASRAPDLKLAVLSMETAPNAFRTGPGRYLLRVPVQPEFEEVAAPAGPDTDAPEPEAGGSGRPALGFMPNYDDAVLGVQIDMLVAGGPAEQAGLAEGDVIIRIGERTIDSVADYMNALADLVVGQQVEVRVQRGEEQKSFQVKVGQRSQ
jgi:uncharacterized iron-regulated protein